MSARDLAGLRIGTRQLANQAVWRVDRAESKGIDATLSYDWSPANVNRNDREFDAGLRYNEPFPVRFHNTVSFG